MDVHPLKSNNTLCTNIRLSLKMMNLSDMITWKALLKLQLKLIETGIYVLDTAQLI